MDLKEFYVKLSFVVIIPTFIIAAILFSIEFSTSTDPPIITLLGFGLLIGSSSFIYFKAMPEVKEEKDSKEGIKAYLLFMLPTIVFSTIMFVFIDPAKPPYLLVYGLAVYLVAYTALFYLAMKDILK